MEVRNIKEDELEGLLKLYEHLHPHDQNIEIKDLQKAWQTILAHPELFHYFVIEKEGQLVATCNLSIIPNLTRGARSIGLIENVVTNSAYRNLGLGRKIVEHAVSVAKEKQCYKVMLLSGADRTHSHSFYKKIGFSGDSKKGFVIKL